MAKIQPFQLNPTQLETSYQDFMISQNKMIMEIGHVDQQKEAWFESDFEVVLHTLLCSQSTIKLFAREILPELC